VGGDALMAGRSGNVSVYSKRPTSPSDLVGIAVRRWQRDELRRIAGERGMTLPQLLGTLLGDEQPDAADEQAQPAA
jgi:hypothetical protein